MKMLFSRMFMVVIKEAVREQQISHLNVTTTGEDEVTNISQHL